jgi:ribosomal protein L11 methyltransferase
MAGEEGHTQEEAEVLEISVEVDPEAAEAVSELFNRYNGGGYADDSEAGEAGGGGAVIEATGFDDFERPIAGEYRVVVRTYIKPGPRGETIRRQIEEGLWFLSRIYPIPEPTLRTVRQQDWADAWKQFYHPMRIGRRILLKPTWEHVEAQPDDLVIELDPGMAFGTGMHPSTRLCIAALEDFMQPGDRVLDVGTGSGILALVALKLGASEVLATDIDTLAVRVAHENLALNGVEVGAPGMGSRITVQSGSVPEGLPGHFQIVVSNILPEVLAGLLDGTYGNTPLAEPLAPGGLMILSGIIEERSFIVLEAAERHHLTLVDRKQETDWLALTFRKA